MAVKFVPNFFARQLFNLVAADYTGATTHGALHNAMGAENFKRYVMAVDPLWGDKQEGSACIILNREEPVDRMELATIGKLHVVADTSPPPEPAAPEPDYILLLRTIKVEPKNRM